MRPSLECLTEIVLWQDIKYAKFIANFIQHNKRTFQVSIEFLFHYPLVECLKECP